MLMKDLEKKSRKGLDALKTKKEYSSLQKEVSSGIDALLNTDKQQALDNDNTSNKEIPVIPITRNKRWLSLAASILFLGAAVYFMIPKTVSPHNLYSSHFDSYPDVLSSTLRGDDVEKSQLMDAMEVYNSSNFKASIVAFEKINELPDPNSNLYLAISHLAVGNDDKALSILNKVPANSELQDGVLWYKALAYLKKNQLDKAESYLQDISTSKHYKSAQAKEILAKLKK